MSLKETFYRYSIVLLLSLITFTSGVFLGISINKEIILNNMVEEYKIDEELKWINFLLDIEKKKICDKNIIYSIKRRLDKLKYFLNKLENRLFINDEELLFLKNYYYFLELKHYLVFKNISNLCNETMIKILFFYDSTNSSNIKIYLYLKALEKKYENKVLIYYFDINELYNSYLFKQALTIFNLNETNKLPILIINEKKQNFSSNKDFERIIKKMMLNNTS